MGPDTLIPQRMLGVALEEKMLEEAHVLQTKEGDLVLWLVPGQCLGLLIAAGPTYLVVDLRQCRIFTF